MNSQGFLGGRGEQKGGLDSRRQRPRDDGCLDLEDDRGLVGGWLREKSVGEGGGSGGNNERDELLKVGGRKEGWGADSFGFYKPLMILNLQVARQEIVEKTS